jgi:hypothetical protein
VQFTKISGQGLFKQYPLLQFNLTAVNGSSAMVFNIEKKEQDINVKGEVKNGQVTDFVPFLPNLKDIVIKSWHRGNGEHRCSTSSRRTAGPLP